MARGALTPEIQAIAIDRLGREISLTELRLMPYVHHVMLNNQRLEPAKINAKEREILAQWRKEKRIEGGASGLAITKDFYEATNEILWLGYVAHEDAAA